MPLALAASVCVVLGSAAFVARPASAVLSGPGAGIDLHGFPGFTAEVQHWTPRIHRWALEHDLPPELVAAVMQIESCGHPTVHSPAGAAGLFQVMPFHFAAGEDMLDPEINAARGLRYLRRSLELADGDMARAFAGYNGGHGIIDLDPADWPSETVRYSDWGARIVADVRAGRVPSPALEEWLGSGGASLCRRAAGALAIG